MQYLNLKTSVVSKMCTFTSFQYPFLTNSNSLCVCICESCRTANQMDLFFLDFFFKEASSALSQPSPRSLYRTLQPKTILLTIVYFGNINYKLVDQKASANADWDRTTSKFFRHLKFFEQLVLVFCYNATDDLS